MVIADSSLISIKPPTFETTIKIISKNKEFPDQLLDYLKLAFDCEPTSPKMYNDEKDVFFQYIQVSKREV